MSDPDRLVDAAPAEGDGGEAELRPQRLDAFIGQRQVRDNLAVFVHAARGRGEALDHVLLHGPPGLGKTTLAQIVARELGVGFRMTSGPVIARAGDLAAILTNLQPREVLFIDEIHRLNPAVEEILYPAMEDFQLDLVIGEGPAARSVRIDLPPFTLVGATTRSGLVSRPLRDRFGIPLRLDFYQPDELRQIVAGNRLARAQPDLVAAGHGQHPAAHGGMVAASIRPRPACHRDRQIGQEIGMTLEDAEPARGILGGEGGNLLIDDDGKRRGDAQSHAACPAGLSATFAAVSFSRASSMVPTM